MILYLDIFDNGKEIMDAYRSNIITAFDNSKSKSKHPHSRYTLSA